MAVFSGSAVAVFSGSAVAVFSGSAVAVFSGSALCSAVGVPVSAPPDSAGAGVPASSMQRMSSTLAQRFIFFISCSSCPAQRPLPAPFLYAKNRARRPK